MLPNSSARLFQSALSCYQQRQYGKAELLCNQLLQLQANSADVIHLKALCCSHITPHKAEHLFKLAIETSATNSMFQKSYANFLLLNRRYSRALDIYMRLHVIAPADADVTYGIAFIHYQQQRYSAALSVIAQTDIPAESCIKWLMLKSRVLLDSGKAAEAVALLNDTLTSEPKHSGLLQTKILALRHLQLPQQALDCLQLMPITAITHYLAGCLYYDLQNYAQAEQQLRTALTLQPDYTDAHAALNKLYWEHNNSAQFLSSFTISLIVVPKSVSVYLSYISHLLMAERIEQAVTITTQAIERCGKHHQLLHALGTLHFKQQNIEQASQLYQQALAQAPDNVRYLLDSANLKIQNQDYRAALTLLEHAKQQEPDNQEVWAYLGLCWRLTADPQHHWLNNYAQLVSVTKLPTPEGYASFVDFWHELKAAVNSMHTTERQPLDQSVRNGTQTVGSLFSNPANVIKIYKNLLSKQLKQYLAGLPQDNSHPLLRRNQPAFRFSGAWSVQLQNDGYHTNHVHPQGWLSVCTYLTVPDSISTSDPNYQGWLKLGETSLRLGEREQIARTICPEEGLCVIFPSYMWHGTVPFQGDGPRITLPCDVVPDI